MACEPIMNARLTLRLALVWRVVGWRLILLQGQTFERTSLPHAGAYDNDCGVKFVMQIRSELLSSRYLNFQVKLVKVE